MVYILLADGCAAVEAVGIYDVLRRAGLACRTVGVTGRHIVSAQGLRMTADCMPEELPEALPELLVLPGGLCGVEYITKSDYARNLTLRVAEEKRLIGAICAAPTALGAWGLLNGRRVTCHPTVRETVEKAGALVTGQQTERDDIFVTGDGPGATIAFALALSELLMGAEAADKVAKQFSIVRMPKGG